MRTRLLRSILLVAACVALTAVSGCRRNETTLDDRTLENRPLSETERPADRSDVFRP